MTREELEELEIIKIVDILLDADKQREADAEEWRRLRAGQLTDEEAAADYRRRFRARQLTDLEAEAWQWECDRYAETLAELAEWASQ